MTWTREAQSPRKKQLPHNWQALRQVVIKRDHGRCVTCGQPGTDVDHIGNPHDHSIPNLRLLCSAHHTQHTQRQAQDGAKTMRARLARPTTPHPGRG